jgi:serine/threonine protein phosphatase PrpC
MSKPLRVSVGQYSDRGRKPLNQDFHGLVLPTGAQREIKGIAVAIADGISSSDVSHIASETAVKSFLQDYYCTSDAWSVKQAGQRVLSACNSWLYAQSQQSQYRDDVNRGYVCTFSALVIKSTTAHIFHLGDSRIYRLNGQGLEQLSKDHRLWVSQDKSYLSRALGIATQCEVDYLSLAVRVGDIFILATDGVYEHIPPSCFASALEAHPDDFNQAAQYIAEQALEHGSDDNLCVQLLRVDELPSKQFNEVQQQLDHLPFAPVLEPRTKFDGYVILRELHASSRSHVYLAEDCGSKERFIIKTPSMDLRGDPNYLERFFTEEWIARRLNSAFLLKAGMQERKRSYLYTVFEYIEGQTLAQWIVDHPRPAIEEVRNIIEQLARGLQALHRMEIFHQDLKPDNIMIDLSGTVKIIDFGAVSVAGLLQQSSGAQQNSLLGTMLYTAPELFLGDSSSVRSELYALGCICYFMLSGRFPYGTKVSNTRTLSAQRHLEYTSVLDKDSEIPLWVDDAIRRAVHPLPERRYGEISEFIHDLRQPNQQFLNKTRAPLLERNPVAFWQAMSFCLAVVIVLILYS